jgi:hypothetical protein
MLIPDVPDSHLEWIHWNYGGGRGAHGLRHLPSGITVGCESVPNVPVGQTMQEVAAVLQAKLLGAGIIAPGSQMVRKPNGLDDAG